MPWRGQPQQYQIRDLDGVGPCKAQHTLAATAGNQHNRGNRQRLSRFFDKAMLCSDALVGAFVFANKNGKRLFLAGYSDEELKPLEQIMKSLTFK